VPEADWADEMANALSMDEWTPERISAALRAARARGIEEALAVARHRRYVTPEGIAQAIRALTKPAVPGVPSGTAALGTPGLPRTGYGEPPR